MPDETSQAIPAIQRQTREVTDLAEISKILGELAEHKELLFFSEVGADLFFIGTATTLDAQRRTMRVAITASPEGSPDIRVGNKFDVFIPMPKADVVFGTHFVSDVSMPDNTFEMAMPSRLHLGCRREHARGSCFGLVEILLRPKDKTQGETLRASLNDISNSGCGVHLPEGVHGIVGAGDRFSDCVLLLNSKPMATCTLEVLHTRCEPETGNLIAGGRFTDLNSIAKHRIAQLIATLDPLWDAPPPATLDSGGQV